ncbi:MAG: peptidase M15 [Burkholderiales bacterium]|nr:peptidase M15 [Burkholderiales bacterium]
MRLTPHFTLAQLTRSETAERCGLDNAPPQDVLENLQRLARGLEAVRELLGSELEISSAYRSAQVNDAVGGTASSQHLSGLAADFSCPAYGSPLDVARAVRDSGLEFDTVILEFGRWVHLSFAPEPRGRVLSIYDAKEGYLAGLFDENRNPIA